MNEAFVDFTGGVGEVLYLRQNTPGLFAALRHALAKESLVGATALVRTKLPCGPPADQQSEGWGGGEPSPRASMADPRPVSIDELHSSSPCPSIFTFRFEAESKLPTLALKSCLSLLCSGDPRPVTQGPSLSPLPSVILTLWLRQHL